MSQSNGGKPVGVRCEDLKRNGQPCRQRNGLRLVQNATICGTHASLREREAARPTTGQPQSIVAAQGNSKIEQPVCEMCRAFTANMYRYPTVQASGNQWFPKHDRRFLIGNAADKSQSTLSR